MNFIIKIMTGLITILLLVIAATELYNYVMPQVYGLNSISYPQMGAMLVLSRIMFGNLISTKELTYIREK